MLNRKKHKFEVFLPVIDETFSLENTISILEKQCSQFISTYLIVLSKTKTKQKSKNIIFKLKLKYKNKIKIIYQKEKFIGGAIKVSIQNIKETHFVMMASDLETNPNDIKKLIKSSLKHPDKIILANRWLERNSFKGYNPIKLILNKLFQLFFNFLYSISLSDLTFGYRIYPSKLLKKFKLREKRHPILLETILIPIKLRKNFVQIPSKWNSRKEGTTNNSFFRNFAYVLTGFRIFFSKKNRLSN